MTAKLRRVLFASLEFDGELNAWSRPIGVFLMSLIAANVVAVCAESVAAIHDCYAAYLHWFEVGSVVVFTAEYILRIGLCTGRPEFNRPFMGRVRYALTPMALVDLLAILPFYLPMLIPLDLRFLRTLRLLRIIRIVKLGRYSSALNVLQSVLSRKRAELGICIFVISILLVLVSGLMFAVEHQAQPETFSSIPATLWWGIATMTTVGYGDIYPVTAMGKILAGMMALLGVGLFALPAGILAGGFAEAVSSRSDKCCPHCGKPLI